MSLSPNGRVASSGYPFVSGEPSGLTLVVRPSKLFLSWSGFTPWDKPSRHMPRHLENNSKGLCEQTHFRYGIRTELQVLHVQSLIAQQKHSSPICPASRGPTKTSQQKRPDDTQIQASRSIEPWSGSAWAANVRSKDLD